MNVEIGKSYRITMIEAAPGEWTSGESVWTVVEVEGTLVKLRNPHTKDRIVNTASWHFVSAELAE